MESPFEYNKPVSGTQCIGRNKEARMLCNLLRERNNILIYGQARIGKKSLIYNSFDTLKGESYNFTYCNINLFNIRCIEAMMLKYTNALLNCFSSSATEWNSILKKFVPNAPYIVDENSIGGLRVTYSKKGFLSINKF